MKRTGQTFFFHRILCLLMAIHVINVSLDAPDFYALSAREDLSFNEMESLVEVILEHGFQLSNAIPEQDDADETGDFSKTGIYDFFYTEATPIYWPERVCALATPVLVHAELRFKSVATDVTSPPPQA